MITKKTKAKYTENILLGKDCNNCNNENSCKRKDKIIYGTCLKWNKKEDPKLIFPFVRRVYPTLIKGTLCKEISIPHPDDKVYYIKPKFKDKDE